MIRGREFHSIISSIFDGDVRNLHESEQVQVNCPKCQEREGLSHPDGKYNLEINTKKRIFRCWKCDQPKFSGTLGWLIKIFGTRTDYDLYKSYAGQYFEYNENDDETEYSYVELPKEFISFKNIDFNNSHHLEAYNYMVLERKIDYELLKKYNIGFCIDGFYNNRIIIPSYDMNGELNYFVSRSYDNSKPTYLNPKTDKDTIIFNEGLINWDSTIYIVEGVFEWLSMPINTIPQLGKTLNSALFYKLKQKKPNIVIVLDPDAYKNSIEIFQKLHLIYGDQAHKIKIVKLKGKYDLDEIRKIYGKELIIKKLRTARQLEVDDYFVDKKFFNEKKYDRYTYNTNY